MVHSDPSTRVVRWVAALFAASLLACADDVPTAPPVPTFTGQPIVPCSPGTDCGAHGQGFVCRRGFCQTPLPSDDADAGAADSPDAAAGDADAGIVDGSADSDAG